MSNDKVQPNHYERRSFIYRKFRKLPVTWSEMNGHASVHAIHAPESELRYAQQMALCDVSYLQRVGFKGAGTIDWLSKQGIKIPENINTTAILSNDCLIARLGANDILILDSLKNKTDVPNKLEQQWHQDYAPDSEPCGFIMPRQDSHACFCVSGINAPEIFSTLCAIDLRASKFANHAIAQTSLARLGAIIIRHDIGNHIAFYVLTESVSAEYCWDCLDDAMQEFSGQAIGSSTLTKLIA